MTLQRLAIVSSTPSIERTGWFASLAAFPGVEHLLVCRPGPVPAGATRDMALLASDAPGAAQALARWAPDLVLVIGDVSPALAQAGRARRATIAFGDMPADGSAPPAFWEWRRGARAVPVCVELAGVAGGTVARHEAIATIFAVDRLRDVQDRCAEVARALVGQALRELRGVPGVPPIPGVVAAAGTPRHLDRLAALVRELRVVARRHLAPRALAKTLAAAAVLTVMRPLRDLVRTARGRHPVRVFTFHRVTTVCRDGMTVSPRVFARQLAYIARTHDVVPVEQAFALAERGTLRRPAAVITFDDGYRSVLTEALPLMRAAGLRGVAYVCTLLLGTDHRLAHDAGNPALPFLGIMTRAEVEQLRDAGWEIGGHTATHRRLTTCTPADLEREIVGSLADLRAWLGERPISFAYPFGRAQDISVEALALVARCGYSGCLSNARGENLAPASRFALRRFEIGGDHTTLAWKARVQGLDLAGWRGEPLAGSVPPDRTNPGGVIDAGAPDLRRAEGALG